jgi:hypothetical protein
MVRKKLKLRHVPLMPFRLVGTALGFVTVFLLILAYEVWWGWDIVMDVLWRQDSPKRLKDRS